MPQANISLGDLSIIVGITVGVCSIAGFYLGRKKESTTKVKSEAYTQNSINNVMTSIAELKGAVNNLTTKIEVADEKREKEYREVLIMITETKSKYQSLELRVNKIEHRCENRTDRGSI